jgi:hypothetical protein
VAFQYFDEMMVDRQLLFWAIATRSQLERWEVCVAEIISVELQSDKPSGQLIWRSQAEHHFMFLAARNLVRAVEIAAESSIEGTLAENLKDVRDLLEHWDENMPVFNTRPRGVPPRALRTTLRRTKSECDSLLVLYMEFDKGPLALSLRTISVRASQDARSSRSLSAKQTPRTH